MSIATKCTCGHSLTGVCTSSVKECNQLINMENNTQLLTDSCPKCGMQNNKVQHPICGHSEQISNCPWNLPSYHKTGSVANTQLPGEVVNEINAKAIEIALKFVPDINSPGYRAIKGAAIKSATAYATKWFTCFEESNKMAGDFADSALKMQDLQQENAELRRQNDKMKQQAEGWRPLLEKVLREDAVLGTISTPTIEKITKFLYGE